MWLLFSVGSAFFSDSLLATPSHNPTRSFSAASASIISPFPFYTQAVSIFLPQQNTDFYLTLPCRIPHLLCSMSQLQVLCSSWLDTGVPPPFTLQRLSGPFSPSQMPPVTWMVWLSSRSHLQQPAGTTAHVHGALCAGGAERLHPRTPELPHGIALSTPQISIKLCSQSGDAWLEPSKPQMGVRCVCLVHG